MRLNSSMEARIIQAGEKYCVNTRQYDHKALKFIIVGDNPGKQEYALGEFFIGHSGQLLRNHFAAFGLCKDFNMECLVFNKMPVYTNVTSELKKVRERITTAFFNEILESCATEVAALSNKCNLPVLIFGKGEIKKSGLFAPFWQKLNAEIKISNLFVFSHPSHNQFSIEWKKYREQKTHSKLSHQELLFKIGQVNTGLVNATYQERKSHEPQH